MALPFQKGDLILFQGDSITDASRVREYPQSLGNGFVFFLAATMWSQQAPLQLRVMNKGVAGDTVQDLQKRWQVDCIDLNPQWLSVMVGMNDALQMMAAKSKEGVVAYEKTYRDILADTVKNCKSRIIMMESFAIPCTDQAKAVREYLDPVIQAARRVAREFNVVYLPLDGVFADACTRIPMTWWTQDGIHPLTSGHGLIQYEWLKQVTSADAKMPPVGKGVIA